jgi:glycosyltransferase involved in cell wall biosynthesis
MTTSDIKQPLLSIIVPIYNVEEFLEECINSILIQEFKDYELILVDDGSPDGCGEICDDYAAKDSRIKVIHKTNGGLSSARNAGIDIAQGSYLSFIDSDDFISSDYYLGNMQYLLSHQEVDMLVAQVCHYDKVNNKTGYNSAKLLSSRKGILEYMFSADYIASAWINIYRSEIFKELRFPEGRIYEDGFVLPRIAEKINMLYLSNMGIYYYRHRDNSITNKKLVISSYKQQLDTYKKIITFAIAQKIEKNIFMHHFLNNSHILLKAVKDYDTEEFKDYIISWYSYPITIIDVIHIKSFKSCIEFLLLKIIGFKILSKFIK